ncbi:MAG: hypothetical protein ACI8QZ_002241 [Chlamydiales bacterium]|jgi:hypothetical protein
MKLSQLTLTAAGLFALTWISFSPDTQGFSTIGGSLGGGQRDYRVFNNFSDATANNNTNTTTASFPGYAGAPMAIWKASVEWGSGLHGSGLGDGSQPGDLGTGLGNFDPSWQGLANGVGTTNDNVHSELAGNGGGVLAFTETPIGNGWRIRYYSNWTWHDGPNGNHNGIDLQGVACHEYGHALGLGHTGVAGATMLPSISGNGSPARSINFDDAAGVQFIYGPIDPGKPLITGVALSAGQVIVSGSNFDTSDNQVWFTQAGSGGDGTPVKIFVVPSSMGGTMITLALPANAGSGDVLVRNQIGGHASHSNAWPFDVDADSCLSPSNYCVGGVHSEGPGARLSSIGDPSVSTNAFTLENNAGPSNKSGLFYYGPNQIQTVFGDGFRCVGGSTKRLPVIQTDGTGYATYSPNLQTLPNIAVGMTQNFQFWFRDPMGPGGTGFNLSDGLSVLFCE